MNELGNGNGVRYVMLVVYEHTHTHTYVTLGHLGAIDSGVSTLANGTAKVTRLAPSCSLV